MDKKKKKKKKQRERRLPPFPIAIYMLSVGNNNNRREKVVPMIMITHTGSCAQRILSGAGKLRATNCYENLAASASRVAA